MNTETSSLSNADKMRKSLFLNGWLVTQIISSIFRIVLTLTIAFLMGAIVIWVSGKDPVQAYGALIQSSLGSRTAIANSLLAATPILFTAMAAAIAFRAGVFNVGVEGSLYLGAFAAAWVGFTFTNLPGWMLIPLCLLAAALVGGVWCFIPGLLKSRLGVDELVTTILLNYVAILFTEYLVNGPFLVPGLANAMSEQIAPSARFVRLMPPSQLNVSFIIALIAAIMVIYVMNKTTLGYEIRMVGDNPDFAKWSGINVSSVIEKVMVIGGILGGLAGAGQVMGVHYRFIAGFSPGLAFTGMTVALLVRSSPIGALFVALLFGILRSGGATMELMSDVPRDLIRVLEATLIFFAAIEFGSLIWRRQRVR
ncbi:MAG: ABC transporter permease [Candidatus Methanomethyliaceae archaeon]